MIFGPSVEITAWPPHVFPSKGHGIVPQHGVQVPTFALASAIAGQRTELVSWKGVHHVGILEAKPLISKGAVNPSSSS